MRNQPANFQDERFFRVKDIRTRYSISNPTIYRWTKSGKFPHPEYLNGMRVWRQSVLEEHEARMLADGERTDAPNRMRGAS